MTSSPRPLRVLIVAEHASAKFGGEAALPLHYFRVLRGRGHPVWLVTHARVRDELRQRFPGAEGHEIHFVEDSWLHKLMHRLSRRVPDRIAYFTLGFVSRLSAQITQRRIARKLIREQHIDVVHQPMPVSPREPSLMFGLGVPVVIGPMNGGMDYPPALRADVAAQSATVGVARLVARALNVLMPGKRAAAVLLVANERTRLALPAGVARDVRELVENGVDLSLWAHAGLNAVGETRDGVMRLCFVGRLVDWKAVDILVEAFASACRERAISLHVIGDGSERAALEALAARLGVLAPAGSDPAHGAAGTISFHGWVAQDALPSLMRSLHALALPSLMECGGAVVLEAMAMGMPVVATRWGGPVDYLDESCGILVEPSSRQALVDGFRAAIVRLADDPALRERMGRAGRHRIETVFDWERKVDRVLEIMAECVEREARGRQSSSGQRVA